ncbi:MAG: exodeoxyribonuclease VII small subunit [Intrasporangium sp.]|uniref:exodeoxyribonuclease VII small subunit n=1 Tax=Intrasporangium sp. TaxID=1925024 RepID=UPI0026483527|nr:exodeoxyribonuclease VII small subunit [Intrasporangium sp.]MDN5794274.1 exodeoxyribonuclease VII small subunit [Intrasporangium sp.]
MTDTSAFPDIAGLRYEQAREELIAVVAKLEAGQAPLEDSMQLWRRGEALAAHCQQWLDGAQAEIERATRPAPAEALGAAGPAEPAGTARTDSELRADDAVFDE